MLAPVAQLDRVFGYELYNWGTHKHTKLKVSMEFLLELSQEIPIEDTFYYFFNYICTRSSTG